MLAALREGDTLVVSNLDRLARSVPDARAIAGELERKGAKLALGATIHDPTDPMGKMFFNIVATFAEFKADLIRMQTREENSRRNAGECTIPGNSRSAISPNLSPYRGPRSVEAVAGPYMQVQFPQQFF